MRCATRLARKCRISIGSFALAILGTGFLALAGWLGGQLVYHEHIGVPDEDATGKLLEPAAQAR